MKRFSLILNLIFLSLPILVFSQKTVTGLVTDIDTSEPILGAYVIVKGTDNATITEDDGSYSIEAKEGDVLVASYVTYTEMEQTVGESNIVDFKMTFGITGPTPVVIGLDLTRADEEIGFSYDELDGEELTKAREPNLINSLTGAIAGANVTSSSGGVGSSSRIVLRGPTSIGSNNQALFVLDGVPINNANYGTASDGGGFDLPNGVADINPDDIETITILKGPNAAALYGAQASNGAIVITTKAGKARKGVGVSFNSSTTFEKPLVLPKYQNSFGQGGNSDFFQFADGQTGDGAVDESWGPPLDVGLEFVQWNSYEVDGAPRPWISSPDNVKDFFDTGVTTNNNISFTGGSEKANFRMSLGTSNQKGIIPNTDFNKYNVSANARMALSDRLSTGISINYIKSNSGNLPNIGYTGENPMQQMIWSGRNVNFSALRDYENLPLAAQGTAIEGTPLNWNSLFQNNPYWVLHNNLNKMDKDRILGNVSLGYEITKGLSARLKTSMDGSFIDLSEQKAMGTNEFQEGYFAETKRKVSILNHEILLTYQNQINEYFDFNINFGGNMKDVSSEYLKAEAPQLELPGLYNISNVKSGVTPNITNRESNSKVNSLLGFAQLAYKEAIYLDVTMRNDWFSVLPDGNNSFLYPSVTTSMVLNKLLNLDRRKVPYLKVRGGWSKVGSSGLILPYSTAQSYGYSAPFGNVTGAFYPNSLNSPDLKPETTRGVEVGVDARLFNSRIGLDVTYYNQKSNDLLLWKRTSASSGFSRALANVANLTNNGVELKLNLVPIKTKDFKLGVDFNFAKNINKVTSLGNDADVETLGGQWNVVLQARVGEPYGVLFGPAFKRNENGDIIYRDGLPVIGESEVLGNVSPDWTGGMKVEMKYKGFSFNSIFDAKIGGDIYTMTNTWGRFAGVLEETLKGREGGMVGVGVKNISGDDANPIWVPNDVAVSAEDWNKQAYNGNVAESSIFDASYVKWRQLMIGYSFPKKWLGKTPFQRAEISFVARNLAILHKNVPHIDPESAFSNSDANIGQEFGQLPSTRSMGFNLNFSF